MDVPTNKKIEIIGLCIMYYLLLQSVHLFLHFILTGKVSLTDSLYVIIVRVILSILLTMLTYTSPPKSPNMFTK